VQVFSAAAGCAFVQFAKWSQAEAAMEAHNSKTRLGTSEVPLVVKFADAKRKEPPPHHVSLLATLSCSQRTLYRFLFSGPTGDSESWTSV
jgi:hypothetical protein